jgi:membrane-associated phospholipid phosphatase
VKGRTAGRPEGRRWLVALPAGALLAAFVWIACSARTGSALAGWDARVTDSFVAWRSPGWSRAFWLLTLLGNIPIMSAVAGSLVVLLAVWGRRAYAVTIAGGLLVADGVLNLAKAAINRARPPEVIALIRPPGSLSLPSGHATLTLVFFGLLMYMVLRRWGAVVKTAAAALAIAVVVAVGTSRVYLGLHWASDVLAGWCLGGAWLAVLLAILAGWERRGHLRGVPSRSMPWGGSAARLTVAVALALIVIVVYVLTALATPLLL